MQGATSKDYAFDTVDPDVDSDLDTARITVDAEGTTSFDGGTMIPAAVFEEMVLTRPYLQAIARGPQAQPTEAEPQYTTSEIQEDPGANAPDDRDYVRDNEGNTIAIISCDGNFTHLTLTPEAAYQVGNFLEFASRYGFHGIDWTGEHGTGQRWLLRKDECDEESGPNPFLPLFQGLGRALIDTAMDAELDLDNDSEELAKRLVEVATDE